MTTRKIPASSRASAPNTSASSPQGESVIGQYWKVVNLDRREYLDPHKLGSGLKLWELIANKGVTEALVILQAAFYERRGGGDGDLDSNWHGPDRVDMRTEGPKLSQKYRDIAARTWGRWVNNRVVIVGDYAKPNDPIPNMLPTDPPIDQLYNLCNSFSPRWHKTPDNPEWLKEVEDAKQYGGLFTDISDDVCAVIEHEMGIVFAGDGWKQRVSWDLLTKAGYDPQSKASWNKARKLTYEQIDAMVKAYDSEVRVPH